MTRTHQEEIVAQFTRQAVPFTQISGHHDAIALLVDMCRVGPEETVLDVACGPGLVACAFARNCRHVTGLDITPAMIEQAKKHQEELGLTNLSWQVGTNRPLPFADNSFTRVITRYSLHHCEEPGAVVAEMVRVCRPGGVVLVADVAMPPAQVEAYDQLERLRDPSHVHALSVPEFETMMQSLGLQACRCCGYGIEIELAAQLKASFPNPGDAERLCAMITADIGVDRLGIAARRVDETVVYTVPVAVYVGCKS